MSGDVPLEVSPVEARALSRLLQQLDGADCERFATSGRFPLQPYDGRCETQVMWAAVQRLRNQLAEAGFDPGRLDEAARLGRD